MKNLSSIILGFENAQFLEIPASKIHSLVLDGISEVLEYQREPEYLDQEKQCTRLEITFEKDAVFEQYRTWGATLSDKQTVASRLRALDLTSIRLKTEDALPLEQFFWVPYLPDAHLSSPTAQYFATNDGVGYFIAAEKGHAPCGVGGPKHGPR